MKHLFLYGNVVPHPVVLAALFSSTMYNTNMYKTWHTDVIVWI